MSLNLTKRVGLCALLGAMIAGGWMLRSNTMPLNLLGAAVGGGDTDAIDAYWHSDVTHLWEDFGLSAEALANGAVFGQAVSINGGDPGLIRLNGGQISYQESDEGGHDNGEDANVIALVGDPLGLGIDGEVGTISHSVTGHGMRVTINFTRTYENPVLFLQVNSNVGTMPLAVYGTTVSNTWAYVKFFEPSFHDGTHYAETIHWAVIDAGSYDLADGRRLVVGKQTITTDNASDFDEISLGGQFIGDAALVTTLQHNNNHKYLGTRLEKSQGTDGIQSFKVRVMGQANADATSAITATVGYMALGQAFDATDEGRLELTSSTGEVLGLVPGMHTNGHCYNLSDDAFDDQAIQATFRNTDGVNLYVIAYEDAFCSGNKVVGVANALVPSVTKDLSSIQASSIRVMWVGMESVAAADSKCVNQGEVLLQNELNSLIFQDDGDLVLYRSNPADGTLWTAWQAGTSLDADASHTACFENGQLIIREHGTTPVFTVGTSNKPYSKLALNSDCGLSILDYIVPENTEIGFFVWSADASSCAEDVAAAEPQGMPNVDIGYLDLDSDGEDELAVVVTKDDGSGYILVDPLGIADFFYSSLGYPLTDDFFASLSATQQAGLITQVSTVADVGDEVSGDEMEAVLEDADEEEKREYYVVEFKGSVTEKGLDGYLLGDSNQTTSNGETYYVAVKFGETYLQTHASEESGVGAQIEFTFVSLEAGVDGWGSVAVSAGTVAAAFNVQKNSFTMGAQAELIAVTGTLGDEDASYLALNVGVGKGFWFDLAMGRNDQYGFTLALPCVPVGVAIYIKGEHAVIAASWVADISVDGANAAADAAVYAWNQTAAFAVGASGDFMVTVENTADEVVMAYHQAEDKATAIVSTAGSYILTGFAVGGDAIDAAFDAIGTAAVFLSNGLGTAGEAVDAAADAVADWTQGAAGTVENTVGDVVDVADDAIDAAEDVVKDAKKGICKLFGC